MSLRKHLTCKTYLEALKDYRIVARLEGDSVNSIVVERDDDPIFRPVPKHYLVGEIADRLYEYEQLGYTPEELKAFIYEHQAYRFAVNSIYGKTSDIDVASLYPKQMYVIPARCNGKTELERRIYEEMYIKNDIASVRKRHDEWVINQLRPKTPEIKDVIFNDPATIVFWTDGTKTVVKATNEAFDPEKGLAMAISKKFFGNKGNYFNQIKKWTEPYAAKAAKRVITTFADGCANAAKGLKKLAEALGKKGD
jgi:hypothetical protein